MSARKERKHTAYHKFGQLLEVLDKRHPLFPNGSDHCRHHRGTLGANVLGNKWGTDVLGELMSWELMSYGELMSGGTNVLDSQSFMNLQ